MILCYDIETDDINSSTCRFGCAVTCELPSMRVQVYGPRRIGELVYALNRAPLRCGHNVNTFDDPVIRRVSGRELTSNLWDLLLEIRRGNNNDSKGFKLDAIAKAMVGAGTYLDGAEIPNLIRAGQWHDVIEHCLQDTQQLARVVVKVLRTGMVSNGITTVRVNTQPLRLHLA